MFKWILTTLLIFSLQNISASTVRLTDTDDPVVNVGNYFNVFNSLGGDGTSTSAPLKLYLPMSGGTDQTKNHILKTALFTDTSTDTLNITIDITNDSGAVLYPTLFVDDQSSTNYNFVSRSSVGCSDASTCEDVVASFSIASICASGDIDCATLTSVKTQTLYLFLSESGIDSNISDPTSGSDGIFIELNISGVVYDGSQTLNIAPVLTSVKVGDTRLSYNYTLSSIQTYFRDIAAFDVASNSGPTFSEHTISENLTSDDEIPVNTSGYFDLKELQNEKAYTVAIAIRDQFGFYTPLSNQFVGVPLSVAEFLEKNQCYFISAGFLEDHFVLDYFRYFRDTYLLSFDLGERFVNFYYATAPQYVPYILKHDLVRSAIKLGAYALYFVLNFGLYILGIVLVVRFLKLKVFKVSHIK